MTAPILLRHPAFAAHISAFSFKAKGSASGAHGVQAGTGCAAGHSVNGLPCTEMHTAHQPQLMRPGVCCPTSWRIFHSSAVCAHAQVMAGQGTVAVELLQQLPQGLDAVIVPVGGGGLIGGIAAVLKAWQPSVQVHTRGSASTAAAPWLGRHFLHHVRWSNEVC